MYQFLSWIRPFQLSVFICIWHFWNSLLQLRFILMHGFLCMQTYLHCLLKCQLPWERWCFQLIWKRCVHHLPSLLGLCQRSLIDDSLPPHRAQMLLVTRWSNTLLLTDHSMPFKESLFAFLLRTSPSQEKKVKPNVSHVRIQASNQCFLN